MFNVIVKTILNYLGNRMPTLYPLASMTRDTSSVDSMESYISESTNPEPLTYEDDSSTATACGGAVNVGSLRYPVRLGSAAQVGSAPTPCRILVLGEPGVGKTAFINALQNLVLENSAHEDRCKAESSSYLLRFADGMSGPFSTLCAPGQRHSLDSEARRQILPYTKYIPPTKSDDLPRNTLDDDVLEKRFSASFIDFVLTQHGKYKIDAMIPDRIFNSRIQANRQFLEILISEMQINREAPLDILASEFDKIIIMSEYPDITTMRSMQYWAENVKSPKTKTIICVNKCDVEIEDKNEDFQLRKAKVVDHFLYQCPVEYISVNTGANIGFIYKYI